MHNNLFLMDVTSEIRMHPAGRGGPSLTFDGKEPKWKAQAELHPGGKGLPSLKMDSTELKHHPSQDSSLSESVPSKKHVDSPRDTPIHTALTSSTLGEAVDGEKSDPREIVRKLHVNWGHASSQQLKRAMAEADGRANSLTQYVDEVVSNCDVCRVFDSAPAIPVAGTSSVSAFNEKLQIDLFLTFSLATPYSSQCDRKIRRRYGMPPATLGLRFLVSRGLSKWTRVEDGKMIYG